jgi:hypothetical protein
VIEGMSEVSSIYFETADKDIIEIISPFFERFFIFRRARRDLDKNSFEFKDPNSAFMVESTTSGGCGRLHSIINLCC